MLGEHDTRTDPDCPKESQGTSCAPKKIIRKIAEVIKHENFGGNVNAPDNDIALVRLNEPVPLYSFMRIRAISLSGADGFPPKFSCLIISATFLVIFFGAQEVPWDSFGQSGSVLVSCSPNTTSLKISIDFNP